MKSIEVIPTEDLMDELMERCEHAVFMGIRTGIKQPCDVISKQWSGDIIKCLGLAEVMKDFLLEKYNKDYKNVKTEEV